MQNTLCIHNMKREKLQRGHFEDHAKRERHGYHKVNVHLQI
jgi:hypothetical protein